MKKNLINVVVSLLCVISLIYLIVLLATPFSNFKYSKKSESEYNGIYYESISEIKKLNKYQYANYTQIISDSTQINTSPYVYIGKYVLTGNKIRYQGENSTSWYEGKCNVFSIEFGENVYVSNGKIAVFIVDFLIFISSLSFLIWKHKKKENNSETEQKALD